MEVRNADAGWYRVRLLLFVQLIVSYFESVEWMLPTLNFQPQNHVLPGTTIILDCKHLNSGECTFLSGSVTVARQLMARLLRLLIPTSVFLPHYVTVLVFSSLSTLHH